jgi:hypothetical protein
MEIAQAAINASREPFPTCICLSLNYYSETSLLTSSTRTVQTDVANWTQMILLALDTHAIFSARVELHRPVNSL